MRNPPSEIIALAPEPPYNAMMPKEKTGPPPWRVGVVSYLNVRPMLWGLEANPAIELCPAVPARLGEWIDTGRVHAGTVPVVDYQRSAREWQILPAGAIGSLGEILTVRLFSRAAPAELSTIHGDTDSHTSVILAQVLWRLCFGRELTVLPLEGDPRAPDAVLLIGDKVLNHLGQWPFELDLGAAWTASTGLPSVTACWAAPADLDARELAAILETSRRAGLADLPAVARQYAPRHGFTPAAALAYLRDNLHYELGPAQQAGLRKFFQLACAYGLLPQNRELNLAKLRNPLAADFADKHG